MTRKHWLLIALALVLAGLSLYLNRDWFAGDNIHIYHRSRPARTGLFKRKKAPPDTSLVNPVVFGFDRKLKLTSVQVIPVDDIKTNKYPHPIWYLVSDSNSVPTKDLTYGVPVKGMHPKISGTTPDDLQPGENYRLLIETAALKAEHDFSPLPKTPVTR
jgi:hypothetical protein